MVSELLHRLQTELDSAEADGCISLLDGWVELPQRQTVFPSWLEQLSLEACRVSGADFTQWKAMAEATQPEDRMVVCYSSLR
jgi:hypothetical protein